MQRPTEHIKVRPATCFTALWLLRHNRKVLKTSETKTIVYRLTGKHSFKPDPCAQSFYCFIFYFLFSYLARTGVQPSVGLTGRQRNEVQLIV